MMSKKAERRKRRAGIPSSGGTGNKTMVMMLIVGVVMGCSEAAEHYGRFQEGETDGENAHCDSE